MDFEQVIALHRQRYPGMQGQDWAKLCYQAEFGAGHMIADFDVCCQRLKAEYDATPPTTGLLFEPIGGGLCRLHLGPLHHEGAALHWVARLFQLAAQPRGTMDGMEKRLRLAAGETDEEYLQGYRQKGCPAVSHTEAYRLAYHPAYRLVPDWARAYWPAIKAIGDLLDNKERVLVAIEGMSGSGKSTLGAQLQSLFGGNLLHMDDFFLPFEHKTPQRLQEPGGNVDHERFKAEVLMPLQKGDAFAYRPFECWRGALGQEREVAPQKLSIVEGCYSLHPAMEAAYDLRIFLKLTPQEQSRRILQRSGAALHERFISEWIPMENRYFEAFQIKSTCHLVFD